MHNKKKMGKQYCCGRGVLEKFVWIVSFVVCWQLGCGVRLRHRTAALLSPSTDVGVGGDFGENQTKNATSTLGRLAFPRRTCPIDYEEINHLPCDEVDALRNVVDGLGFQDVTVDGLFCDETTRPSGFKCSCPPTGTCHITSIKLQNLDSSGSLHEDVSRLQHLQTLIIYNSHLKGPIPPELGKLSSLRELGLKKNQLTGPIPSELRDMENLEFLSLSQNQLNGTIPTELGDLSSLTYLDLSVNQLTGEIPENFRNLQSLTDAYLNANHLNGHISIVCEWSSLIALDLRYNRFKDQLPPKLGSIKPLQVLLLDENLFTGEIPKAFANLINLEYLSLTSNNFTGNLLGISHLTQLQRLEVGGNNLTGPIPSSIKYWDNLFYLNLLGNNFNSPLPQEILNMSNLQTLWVSDLKNPKSTFPDNVNLPNITSLIMRNCFITGKIPPNFTKWGFLDYLDLSFNKLEGTIPESPGRQNLTELYLTGNMLTGKIPKWINELDRKDLSYNKFSDEEYPPEASEKADIAHGQTMNIVDVADQNQIINENTIKTWNDTSCRNRGRFTKLAINSGGERLFINGTHYEADENLSNYYFSENASWAYTCSGDFISQPYSSSVYVNNITCGATTIYNQDLHRRVRLCPVELTYYGFCLIKGSYTVKLYFAETVYVDDSHYSSSGKRIFDVYIQGEKVVQDLDIKERANGSNKEYVFTFRKAKVRQDHLLQIRLLWTGKGSVYNPPHLNGPLISAIEVTANFVLTELQIVVVTAASILALVLVLALLWRLDLISDRSLRGKQVEIHGKSYSLKKIVAATRNFSDKMKIGTGHFGTLYKAQLPDETVVAVKRLDPELMQQQGDRIIKEFYTVQRLDHPNLVRLFSGYSKGDLSLLIYEYMNGGSLETALFEPSPNSSLQLNWEARLEICKGVAKGLKYLHEGADFKTIHGDVKPTNIWLDGSTPPTAKLSDVGLAKFHEEENPFLVTKNKRNLMYIAPEYASMTPTVKSDVYSFGVVMLEILSGKRALEYKENGETESLLYKANQLHREKNVEQFIDSKLQDVENEEAVMLVGLAMKCVHQFPDRRPTMSEVLSVLNGEIKIDQVPQAATPSGAV